MALLDMDDLFPQFALAGVTAGRGEFAVVNRGTRARRDSGSQSRWAGKLSIGSEVAAAVTHNSDSDSR